MKPIDFEILKVSREYESGIRMSNGAERIHKYTINYPNHPIDGKHFWSSTWTKYSQKSGWGKGKTVYFFKPQSNSDSFKTAIDCVNALNKTLIHKV